MGGDALADPHEDLRSRPHSRPGVAAGLRPCRGDRGPGHRHDVPVSGSRDRRTWQRGSPVLPAPVGTDVLGMVLDADVDWAEVAELLIESYCLLAPRKLVELVDRPAD